MTEYHDNTRPIMSATLFDVGAGKVQCAALIRGDGVDLVTKRPGFRPQTVQLSVNEARELSRVLVDAANESASDV